MEKISIIQIEFTINIHINLKNLGVYILQNTMLVVGRGGAVGVGYGFWWERIKMGGGGGWC